MKDLKNVVALNKSPPQKSMGRNFCYVGRHFVEGPRRRRFFQGKKKALSATALAMAMEQCQK